MDEETKKRFDDHEKRIRALENKPQKKEEPDKNYRGLTGGIELLIDNGFFKEPKTANEVMEELKREGYHHSLAPIANALSVGFTKNKKKLNRVKDKKIWRYVLRK